MIKKLTASMLGILFLLSIFAINPLGASAYQEDYRHFHDYRSYYNQSGTYSYSWTQIGKNIQKTDQYSYAIINQSADFYNNEDVYVLALTRNVRDIDSFQIKFDVYENGNRYVLTNEVPVLWPRGQEWGENYSWANLGKLPVGSYEVRTHIRINNGAYTRLNAQTINVRSSFVPSYNRDNYRFDNRDYGRRDNRGRRNYDIPAYTFDWTRLNTSVARLGTYKFDMTDHGYSFYSDDNIKALTKLSNINNIGFFQVKLDLYQNGVFKREYLGMVQKPDDNYWGYNYTQSDLGQQPEGEYTVKTYISVDGSSFKLINTKNFNVKNRRVSTQNNYYRGGNDWRIYDGGRRYNDWYYGNDSYCTGYYSCQNQNYYRYR